MHLHKTQEYLLKTKQITTFASFNKKQKQIILNNLMNKNFFVVIAFLTMTLTASAQNKMRISFNDGSVQDFPVSTIKDISWIIDEQEPTTPDTSPAGTEAVDLGLSVRWASMNIGAQTPSDYGDYYAWGETDTKSDYSWETYTHSNGSRHSLTKYCTKSEDGIVDNIISLEKKDDVASVKWGGAWRMPTKEEQEELIEKCSWNWTTKNGSKGYVVTGPNGNSIFLPAAGARRGDDPVEDLNRSGYYWSSSLGVDGPGGAYDLYFLDTSSISQDYDNRSCGRSVRAVRPK